MNRNFILILLLCFQTGAFVSAQSFASGPDPQVGKRMPNFRIANVYDYRKSDFSLDDAKGKWLVLAFWYRGCAASVEGLVEFDALYKAMKGRIEFVLVGKNDRRSFGKGIEPLYRKLKERQNFKMPHAFDSVLCQKWEIWSFPRVIIVDTHGVVRHITTADDLTADKIEALMNGEQPSIYPWIDERPRFKATNIPDSSNLLAYRSTLTRWNGERSGIPTMEEYKSMSKLPGIRISRASLSELFKIALMGRRFWYQDSLLHATVYPQPLIEVADKTAFEFDYLKGTGIYNYELILPDAKDNIDEIKRVMLNDLENIFGYQAKFEERMMPVWSLTAKPDAVKRLRTRKIDKSKRTNMNGDGGAAGFIAVGFDMRAFMDVITRYINDYKIPYYDNTGITFKFDIEMDALMTDREQVLEALRENGMDLTLTQRKMKVMVITDHP